MAAYFEPPTPGGDPTRPDEMFLELAEIFHLD
jgi:hypothetical protein